MERRNFKKMLPELIKGMRSAGFFCMGSIEKASKYATKKGEYKLEKEQELRSAISTHEGVDYLLFFLRLVGGGDVVVLFTLEEEDSEFGPEKFAKTTPVYQQKLEKGGSCERG